MELGSTWSPSWAHATGSWLARGPGATLDKRGVLLTANQSGKSISLSLASPRGTRAHVPAGILQAGSTPRPQLWLSGSLSHGMWDFSSPIRDQSHVPCAGRQTLNHGTTQEVHRVVSKGNVDKQVSAGCLLLQHQEQTRRLTAEGRGDTYQRQTTSVSPEIGARN